MVTIRSPRALTCGVSHYRPGLGMPGSLLNSRSHAFGTAYASRHVSGAVG